MSRSQRSYEGGRAGISFCFLMSALAFLLVSLPAMVGSTAKAAEPDQEQQSPDDPGSEQQDLVYLAPQAPIFVRMKIRINGDGLQEQRRAWAQELFQSLDKSGDGMLAEDELEAIPPVGHLVPDVPGAGGAISGDVAPDANEDGQVSPDELTDYLLTASGTPFRVSTAVQQTGGSGIGLFDRLDRNEDRLLSAAEVAGAARCLRLMDVNLDDYISANEIAIPTVFGNPVQESESAGAQVASSLALLQPVSVGYTGNTLARKLLQKYDRKQRGGAGGGAGRGTRRRFMKDRQLTSEELGCSDDELAACDANSNGRLDLEELKQYLATLQPSLEVSVDFGTADVGPTVELTGDSNLQDSVPFGVGTNEHGEVLLQLGTRRFRLTVNPATPQASTLNAAQQFASADNDSNEYLDTNEAARLGVSSDRFRLVDTDGDGMVVESEYTSYLTQQQVLGRHGVNLSLVGSSKTLMSMLDVDGSSRLDADELDALAARLMERDRNADGQVSREEVTSASISMVLSKGSSGTGNNFNQFRVFGAMRRTPQRESSTGGWFGRMDRNADGVLSPREFLGSAEKFAQLDADGNGNIDAAESKQ